MAAQREAPKRMRMRPSGWKGLAPTPGKVASELFRGRGVSLPGTRERGGGVMP
ncbi:MAG: hypothetical protein IJU05_00125 [Schwartzia sp.]|nr:hypothetical protein [Schwartzia sp. (in: firmicutes)]